MLREFPEWSDGEGKISSNWTSVLTAAGVEP